MNKEDMIYDLLKEVKDDVKEIKIEQIHQGEKIAKNTEDLEEHMSRTLGNEELIHINKKELDEKIQILQDHVKRPLVNWEWIKSNITWIVVTLGGLSGVIWQISKLGWF